MLGWLQATDGWLMLFLQEHVRCGVGNAVMIFFSSIGQAGAVWLLLSAFLLLTKKYRRVGFMMLLAMAIGYLLNDMIIKNIVCRPRPFLEIAGLTSLVRKPASYSFPSGHACSSFAAALILAKTCGKKGVLAYIPAALIALSRPYVGVHYVSDILVGACIGTLSGWVAFALFRSVKNKKTAGKK